MKRVLFFVAILVFSFGCTSKKNEPKTKTLVGWDAYMYNKATQIAKAGSNKLTFDYTKAEAYFIAQWNTPSYYCHNGEFTGIAHDGGTFLGVAKGDSVYFLFDNEIISDDYVAQTGDSIITVEVRIHKNGVSNDPRKTCWWIASVKNDENNTIDDFWVNAIPKPDKDFEQLNPLLEKIKKDLSGTKGKSVKQKIINFTAKSVSGSPKDWDAWTWPGYYEPGCPGFVDAFSKFAEHENDVAVVPL